MLKFFDRPGNEGNLVYLDFQKASGKIHHLRLLRKLWSYMRREVLMWRNNWLEDREQTIRASGSILNKGR